MLGFKLAELFVEFVATGVDQVARQMQVVHGHLEKMNEGMAKVGRLATIGMAAASASLGGFIRAGTQGSAMAQQFGLYMEIISRNIAGIFRPELEKAVDVLRRISEWFRGLSDQQRENIANWIKGAAAAGVVLIIIPKIVAGVMALIAAFKALAVAISTAEASTGIGALLPIIGQLLAGVTALVVGTEVGRGAFARLWEVVKPVVEAVGNLFNHLWENVKVVFDAIGTAVESFSTAFAEVLVEIFAAIQPLLPVLTDLARVMGELLATVIQALGVQITGLLKLLVPVVSFFAQMAKVILEVLIPPLKIMAAILEWIVKAMAMVFGVKLEGPVDKKTGKPGERSEFGMKMGGFSSIDSAYQRVAEASIKIGFGKPIPEQQLDAQIAANQKLDKIDDKLGRLKPAVA